MTCIAAMVNSLYTNTVLSHKEVRQILRDHAPKFFKSIAKLDVDGYYAPPQAAQVSLAEAVGEHTTSLLTNTNESEEAAIERTYQEGTKTLLEAAADEVEAVLYGDEMKAKIEEMIRANIDALCDGEPMVAIEEGILS